MTSLGKLNAELSTWTVLDLRGWDWITGSGNSNSMIGMMGRTQRVDMIANTEGYDVAEFATLAATQVVTLDGQVA
eukprot:m.4458 g.4458  ORF g.4458 m.4458 type:complete len:75 (-) comp6965_c0_seq1:881-1105(-)